MILKTHMPLLKKIRDFLQMPRETGKSTKWQKIKVTKLSNHNYDGILILPFCCGDHSRFFLNKKWQTFKNPVYFNYEERLFCLFVSNNMTLILHLL